MLLGGFNSFSNLPEDHSVKNKGVPMSFRLNEKAVLTFIDDVGK